MCGTCKNTRGRAYRIPRRRDISRKPLIDRHRVTTALKLILALNSWPQIQLKESRAMDAEFDCIACNVKRIVIGVTPVARGYEMRSLACSPNVATSHRLVLRHRRRYSKTLGYRLCRGRWLMIEFPADHHPAGFGARCNRSSAPLAIRTSGRTLYSARTSPPHLESRKDRCVRRRRY